MSLMIKGMDMPKNKGLFYDWLLSLSFDGSGEIFFNGKSYPIAEIPKPHGRLIDADRLIAILKSTTAISQSDYDLFNHIVGLIEHQPTVIEAEE